MRGGIAALTLFALAFQLALVPAAQAQTRPDALALYRQERYADAVAACLAEIEETPRDVDSYVILCWSLVRLERYEEAETWAARGRGVSRYDPRLLEIAGEALFFQGKNERALGLFQEYIAYAAAGARVTEAYDFMGEIFLRLGKYRHADIAFSTALQYDGQSPERWTRAGYAREMAEDYRYSLEAYDRALALNPNNQDATLGRSRVVRKMN